MEKIKAFFMSKRTYGIWLFSALVLAWLFWTDPDKGDSTRDMLQNLVSVGLAFTAAHIVRKFYLDYIKLQDHVDEAKKGNIGSGLVVLGTIIFTCVAALIFSTRAHATDVRTYVPVGAKQYCPELMFEKNKLWPDHPDPAALCSLVEQESCISLTHPTCWNPKSRLKTSREEGAGFGQITRAYTADGKTRFDALQAAKQLEPSLNEWTWSNVYDRPDLQLRAIVAMNRDCARRLSRIVSDPAEVLRMCDAAYNGGYEGMQQERRACGQRAGCNPQKWAANVANVCLKSKVKWKGYGASACDINRCHVDFVFNVRHDKYLPFVRPT
ncbi:hypothetical protein ACO0LM_10610 [Undibacterium sp. Di26W]|uniref:hypothetical protein n=1 Tax=Undibacterium sp. Di26W TaxID=3413035 RepID=UPI003BF2BD32